MNMLELLRFKWKPQALRLLVAALAEAGPASRARWVVRSGIPGNHLIAVMQEVQRLGGCKLELSEDGIAVHVQPVSFWRVTPLVEAQEWAQSWGGIGTTKLDLATEARTLADALSSVLSDGASLTRNTGSVGPVLPDSGSDMPRFRATPRASDRDRSVLIEKERSLPRVPDRDRGDRTWLLEKLARMPTLHGEVMRPQGGQQQRMSRMFWELDEADQDWLRGVIGDLADNGISNKAAWFNTAATKRLEMLKKAKGREVAQ